MTFKAWLEATEHSVPISQDSFLHFTLLSRAKEIVAAGKLLMQSPYPKFGTDSVDAISVTFGQWVPDTQLTHIKRSKTDPVVAVWFKTNTLPYAAYPEEVKWNTDVPLLKPRIISAKKAQGMLSAGSEDYEIRYTNG